MNIMTILQACNLQNRRFITSHRADKNQREGLVLSSKAIDSIIVQEIIKQLCKVVVKQKESIVTRQESRDFVQYECELFFLERKELVLIIDTAIQQMPFSLIQEIRDREAL